MLTRQLAPLDLNYKELVLSYRKLKRDSNVTSPTSSPSTQGGYPMIGY